MRGFILLLLAIFLSVIFYPVGWLYSLITFRASIKKLGNYFFVMSVSVDQLGNTVMSTLFNDVLIVKHSHKFGNEDETISMVLGINKEKGTLTKIGRLIATVLNKIDKNHVEKAIEKCPNHE